MGRRSLESIKKLTKKQQEGVRMLVSGMPQKKVIEPLEISSHTLHGWLTRCPLFKTELVRLQRENVETTAQKTFSLANASLSVLAKMIADTETPPSVRAQCCATALGHSVKLMEHQLRQRSQERLEARLAQLEKAHSEIIDISPVPNQISPAG